MAGKPRTRPTLTKAQIAKALQAHNGLYSNTARALGVTYNAIQQRVKGDPELMQIVEDVTTRMLDRAENKLYQKINAGNMTAIIFYLKCKGKDRGYVEKQQLEAGASPQPERKASMRRRR